jgi:Fe-coproporphyrin III synthase
MMIDLIYGLGITDIVREILFYFSLFGKMISIKVFNARPALYGSADTINVCNLHCSLCEWWLNRKDENQNLSVEEWRQTIRKTFKKQPMIVVL